MKWMKKTATYYKKNGEIDRKKECDQIINSSGNYKVLKSCLRSSVYYAAVMELSGLEFDKKVWAAIIETKSENKKEFCYEQTMEFFDPKEDHCPKMILNLLTSTKNQVAKEWRKRCLDNVEKSNKLSKLDRLKNGSVIEFRSLLNLTNGINIGDLMTLTKINQKWTSPDHFSLKKTYIDPEYKILKKI